MAIEISGVIFKIMETQQVTEKFSKREVILRVEDGKYPQYCAFQMTGDRCSNLDEFSEQEEVKVTFNLRGREWTSPKGEVRYFNSLDIWKIELVSERQTHEESEYGDMDEDVSIPF